MAQRKEIKLAEETISKEDMDALADWIKTYPRLTKGELTVEYEKGWSDWIGTKHSTFVNSGSSANLLMLATLMEAGDLEPGDSVVVPALSWATDLAPVMQLGLKPILCDCNLLDYSLDLTHFEQILATQKPKATILVSVLGLAPNMKVIVSLCEKYDSILLEDCCESLGTEIEGRKLGTFGAMSTFSTYFGHHISTIEGGMVCTSNDKYNKIMKSVRSHGWSRDWTEEEQQEARKEWGVSDFDSLYTFFYAGLNIRATDLQAFLGLRQLKVLPSVCQKRSQNFSSYQSYIDPKHQVFHRGNYTSNFAFPIISENRDLIAEKLTEAGIECRPLISGSMGRQPFYVKKYGVYALPKADKVKDCGMYLPNHHLLSEEDIIKICDIVNSCVE